MTTGKTWMFGIVAVFFYLFLFSKLWHKIFKKKNEDKKYSIETKLITGDIK
jgi:hypothetical protein